MSEMKHTPTPWPEVEYQNDVNPGFYEWWEIEGVADFRNKEDAEFARECVNSHASLVEENARLREACTALLASWDKGDGQERRGEFEGVEYWSPAGRMIDTEFIAAIREALK